MSDSRNDSSQSPRSASPTHIGRLPDAKIIEHLKATQKMTIDRANEIFTKFLTTLESRLLEYMDGAKTNQELNQYNESLREMRQKAKEWRRHFIGYLGEGFVKFKNKQLVTRTGEEKYKGDMLSLVDNDDLEETIALSSVTHRAEDRFGEALWFLHQRFAVLNGGEKVDESSNPVSPIQFCESLRKALKVLSFNTKAKIICYKVFDKAFMEDIGSVLDDVNHYLAKQGILPNLRYFEGATTPRREESAVAVQGWGDVPADPANGNEATVDTSPQPNPAVAGSAQHQGNIIDAIRVLQSHIAQGSLPNVAANAPQSAPQSNHTQLSGGAGSAGAPPLRLYSNQQLVSALQSLQQQALSVTHSLPDAITEEVQAVTPQVMAAVGLQLTEELKKESADGKVDPVDMHTIELVGMLFEYMLSDEHLPDSIKAILSYLHTPFLKVAFLDPNFFEQTEHPARLLLNSLAEAGSRWVSNDGSSQYEIYTKIKQIVSRVLEDFDKDVRLFAELLLEFSSYVKKIARRQDLMEKRAMEKVQGEEKLREVKIQVNSEIRNRTDGRELPSAVLLLLLQPWSDYLAFLLLRYGENSDIWKKALGAVDDLLWSIEPKQDPKEKTRQAEMVDDLLDVIEAGFETIGYDQTKGKKLIEALVSLQKMALQSRKAEPAPAPMRDKLESEAAEKAGQTATPAQAPNAEEAKMVENLKMIEFGTWFEFEGGKRLKVAWYNSKTMHYMLVDQMGKKVAMRSGLELARAMLTGKAKVIAGSTKPFFERALENIFQNLNAKAEAMKPDAADEQPA